MLQVCNIALIDSISKFKLNTEINRQTDRLIINNIDKFQNVKKKRKQTISPINFGQALTTDNAGSGRYLFFRRSGKISFGVVCLCSLLKLDMNVYKSDIKS